MRPTDFTQFLCVLGAGADVSSLLSWIDADVLRHLAFVTEDGDGFREKFAASLHKHPRIRCYSIDSPLQIELIAKQVAWRAVLLKLEIWEKGIRASEQLCYFKHILEMTHMAANLLLSDASDCGCDITKNVFLRSARPIRQGMDLLNAFSKIPAIVIGAGPSLGKQLPFVKSLSEQALLIAGGSALNILDVEPHFAASLDRSAPHDRFKRSRFLQTPFCFQDRMNQENFALLRGEVIRFPDSHFSLFEDEPFDGGWTVGTFCTQLAVFMGCDPIILVGMDLCYEGTRKYTALEEEAKEGLCQQINNKGERVFTQTDWLMARAWLEKLCGQHRDRTWLYATEGGLKFKEPLQCIQLGDMCLENCCDLRKKVDYIVQKLSFFAPPNRELWKQHLQTCAGICKNALETGQLCIDFEDSLVYQRLLVPLWNVWAPFFERELILDPHPEKMEWNQVIFFQQVIQKHLDAIG